MRKIVALLVTLALSCALSAAQDGGPFAHVGAGEPLPSFSVTLTDGSTIESSELQGRITWITLWASWCPSCRKEFKRLAANEEFTALVESGDILFLPIAREESSATVAAWLKEKGYPYISGIDTDREVYNLFAIEEIPRNIIVGADGTILYHGSGGTKRDITTLITICKEETANE